MANPEHLEILKQGVEVWNKWKRKNHRIQPDLSDTDLDGVDFSGMKLNDVNLSNTNLANAHLKEVNLVYANLSHTNLSNANLRWANLMGANLNYAKLRYAKLTAANLVSAKLHFANLINTNFSYANLSKANLTDANLNNANLSKANLSNANLSNARLGNTSLRDANLSNAYIGWTTFGNNDLSKVQGLETMFHYGPSTIGIDTLYRSKGMIPIGFLQGCGVPDNFITYLPSLVGAEQALQFYSSFISYSHKDEEFANRLHSRLRDAHLRVWFAPEDIKGGEKLHEQIDRAIQIHDRLLIVLSEESMQSEWVMTEIRRARKTEIEENRRKLFPISIVDFDKIRGWKCFDADTGKDLAVEVREYYIPDFSNWKDHDSFEKSFDRLLRDLKAEEK